MEDAFDDAMVQRFLDKEPSDAMGAASQAAFRAAWAIPAARPSLRCVPACLSFESARASGEPRCPRPYVRDAAKRKVFKSVSGTPAAGQSGSATSLFGDLGGLGGGTKPAERSLSSMLGLAETAPAEDASSGRPDVASYYLGLATAAAGAEVDFENPVAELGAMLGLVGDASSDSDSDEDR